ncbi:MAG TPA: stage V sporulation protein AC [Bacillales bacterium]|nr:stage V sporulation protein AC [Bacillales bacterium]
MAVNLNNPSQYTKNIKAYHPKPNYVKNCIRAFWTGGLICAFGQLISTFYVTYFNFTETTAANPTVATLIFIASLLTGFGVYDKIGQFAGAGSLVPVTGFANSVTSAALEHKSEGIVLGVAANMFKLSGSVIVFGVVSAYIVGILRLIFRTLIS